MNEKQSTIKCMTRIYTETKGPASFMEDLIFTDEIPYIVLEKTYPVEDIVPLHCARTIEVLACSGLIGEVSINNKRHVFRGNQVFIIPPYVIHSTTIHPCTGKMYQFQSDLNTLRRYIDVKSILGFKSIHVRDLSNYCPEYDQISEIIEKLIKNDNNFSYCITLISQLFNILEKYRSSSPQQETTLKTTKNEIMRDTILWTQEHFAEKISLEDVSQKSGYSKFHFCTLFKEATGVTYIDFLNSVRVSNACNYLQEGDRIADASRLCGFTTPSYFTQVFRKIHGITPKEYQNNLKKLNS